jgi:hypothetical protein
MNECSRSQHTQSLFSILALVQRRMQKADFYASSRHRALQKLAIPIKRDRRHGFQVNLQQFSSIAATQ